MNKSQVQKAIVFIILFTFAIIVSLPLWMLIISSFLGQQEAVERLGMIFDKDSSQYANIVLWVKYPTLRHYIELLLDTPEFFIMFWNSMKQESCILLGQLLVGMPAAWAFARYRFPGRHLLFTVYTILMVLPFQVTMVSSYLVLDKMGLMDTMWSVVLPNIFATFPIFLMTKFFQRIPKDLIESACLDGASELQLFAHIGIPMGAPGILSALILGFIEYWNNVEQPVAFLSDKTLWPISLYMSHIRLDNIGLAMVAAVISLIPAILLFLSGQKYLEQGIMASGLKE